VVGLLLTLLAVYVLFQVRLVVVLALLPVLYATAIEWPVRALERWRIPRRAAVLVIDIALVAGLVVPVLLLTPAVGHELARFRREEPARLRLTDAAWATSPHAILRGPGRRALDRVITSIETPAAPSKRAVGEFSPVR